MTEQTLEQTASELLWQVELSENRRTAEAIERLFELWDRNAELEDK